MKLPNLDTATSDEIRDLAYNITRSEDDLYVICGSSAHVRAVALQVEALELAERAASEALEVSRVEAAGFQRAFEDLQHRLTLAEADLATARIDISTLKLSAAFERTCMAVTGEAPAELQARWRAEDAAELEALERGRKRADRAVYTTAEQVAVMR